MKKLPVLIGCQSSRSLPVSVHYDRRDYHEQVAEKPNSNEDFFHGMLVQPCRASKCEYASHCVVDDRNADHSLEHHVLCGHQYPGSERQSVRIWTHRITVLQIRHAHVASAAPAKSNEA